ncbi:MAG: ferrochelatase [Gemmatimonadota bacterium]
MSPRPAKPGVLLIDFGEPESPDIDSATRFLERIFLANANIEALGSIGTARSRSAELARRRAPGLVADYERIGGSPLRTQAAAQAAALSEELARRGSPVPVASCTQFTEPTIAGALERLRNAGVETVSALPVYPLCGPSTTVASLREVDRALAMLLWDPHVVEITGWHRHPSYVRLRADAIRTSATHESMDLSDDRVELVFSAHGTPMRYVRDGSRYVDYVEDGCARVAAELGVSEYSIGYQNHSNRGVEWTAPDVEAVLKSLAGSRSAVVVDAVSFVHEQSETLAELDLDLRKDAEEAGLRFHRVPVPHDAPELIEVLADLVEASWGVNRAGLPLTKHCTCRPGATVCLNGRVEEGR